MISITKIFCFEAAHRISNYNGACSNIHGHSYKLHVTITGDVDPDTCIIFDFKALKKVVEETVIGHFDHALVLKKGTTEHVETASFKLLLLDKEPTAETMLEFIQLSISNGLPDHIQLKRLMLFETETSYACWESD